MSYSSFSPIPGRDLGLMPTTQHEQVSSQLLCKRYSDQMKSIYGNPPPKPLVFVSVVVAIGLVTTLFVAFPDRSLSSRLISSGFVLAITAYNLWAAYQPPAAQGRDTGRPGP